MIGIDAVDIERLRALIEREPRAETHLFTEGERAYCNGYPDPILHLAGTLATKEAVIKAASLGPLVSWCRRIEVQRGRSGAPRVYVDGGEDREINVSISHDKGLAVAVAVMKEPAPSAPSSMEHGLRPNQRLLRYLASGLQP